MKILFIFISLLLNQFDCNQIDTIRTEYHKVNSEKNLNEFIKLVEANDCDNSIPYKASAKMQSANYAFWPVKKLKLFNNGKKDLENYIIKNPENIEARYIRVLIQDNIPKILGYHKNKLSDIDYIKKHISTSNLPEYYKEIISTNIQDIR